MTGLCAGVSCGACVAAAVFSSRSTTCRVGETSKNTSVREIHKLTRIDFRRQGRHVTYQSYLSISKESCFSDDYCTKSTLLYLLIISSGPKASLYADVCTNDWKCRLRQVGGSRFSSLRSWALLVWLGP